MVGAKTLGCLVVAAIALLIADLGGALAVSHLTGLTASACLIIGLFAGLSVALISLGWRPDEPSRGYIGIARGESIADEWPLLGRGETRLVVGSGARAAPRDLPGAVQRGILAIAFLCIGLIAFTNEATAQLVGLPDRLSQMSAADYCVDAPAAEPEAPTEIKLPEARGCALIQRAYDLGYTKKLGSCAPKVMELKKEALKQKVCELRQPDEPFLHYTWRLLADRTGEMSETDPVGSLTDNVASFRTRLGYLDALFANQWHSITASPRASHHLWTNLADPTPASLLAGLFVPRNCHSHYSTLHTTVDFSGEASPESALLDHVFGQLLFNPVFGAVAGNCREYTIHWNASVDSCRELTRDPVAFLDAAGALDPVRAVLDRHRRQGQLRRLADELGSKLRPAPPPDPRRIASFQCLMIDPKGTGLATTTAVPIDGYQLTAREIRTPRIDASGASQLDVYRQVSALLTGGEYRGPTDQTSLTGVTNRTPTAEDLAGSALPLTKLELLREADPFLGAGWPLERPELAEVYPLHLHLTNFTDVFRRRYRLQRGRL